MIDKKPGETKDDFISRCISIEISSGREPSQAAAICYAKWDEFAGTQSVTDNTWSTESPISIGMESYSDYPESVKNNAKRGIELNDSVNNRCATQVGKVRAQQLANGEPISVETIQRMYSYLSRSEVYYNESDTKSCGTISYLLWGGLSAKSWSHNKLKELGLIDLSEDIQLSKISIDYDGTLSTSKGKELAKRLISEGNDVYIISARGDKSGMLAVADELGIPHGNVYATGSNKSKEEKIKELNIKTHYDNNPDVVKALPGIGNKFSKVKKVIFSEDFNEDVIREYKEAGFSVHILSKRRVQRKDNKVYNKLKSVGLSEDNLLFGDIKLLDKKYNFDVMLHDTEDPILNALLTRGEDISKKKVLKTTQIENMSDAIKSIESLRDVDMKFATVRVVFTYELRDDVTGPKELATTRDFCKRVLGANKAWTIDEINSLPTEHLTKMGLPADIFAFRGGFFTTKGGKRGIDTTPFCRHIWKSKVIMD